MIRLRDIMTTDVVAFSPETSLLDAIETLAERHISGAPVLSGNRIVGVISGTDILEFVASNPALTADFGEAENGDRSALANHVVSEAMSGGPVSTLPPDATVMAAAELMRTAEIHRVFVSEDGVIVGVVTSLDVTRALADRKVVNRMYVFPKRSEVS
ncbi:MAG: CBS domain-containing protein [Gemmatimonadota bacterium]|nr:CBS domain-containing protein [Gemmatimonadota bacterium]